jgi:Ca2+-binding EF-hand superfamily protein
MSWSRGRTIKHSLSATDVDGLKHKIRAAAYTPHGQDLRAIFNRFDTSNDGFLSEAELMAAVQRLVPGRMDHHALTSLMRQIDFSHDNRISYDEFIAFCHDEEEDMTTPLTTEEQIQLNDWELKKGRENKSRKQGHWKSQLRTGKDNAPRRVRLSATEVHKLKLKLRAAAYGPTGANFKKLFDIFDIDQNGTLSPDELGTVVQRMLPGAMDRQALDQMMVIIDASGDGRITYEEFLAFIEDRVLPRSPEKDVQPAVLSAAELQTLKLQLRRKLRVAAVRMRNKLGNSQFMSTGLRAVFQQYDKNGDQKLSVKEFTCALDELVRVSTAQAKGIFQAIDEDGSGYVDYDEFLAFSRG